MRTKCPFAFVLTSMLSAIALTPLGFAESPIVKSEFIYDAAPFPSCHASTIVETSDGLVAAWFGGTDEGRPDVGIWFSRLAKQDRNWTKPVEVATGSGFAPNRLPTWNPVLFQPKTGPLMLFYKVGPSPSKWWGMLKTSDNQGKTWNEARRLPEGLLGPIKNKPVQVANGDILCPTSTEDAGWRVHFERSSDGGSTWSRTDAVNDGKSIAAIQPSVLFLGGDQLLALGRTRQKKIFQVISDDAGKTWGKMTLTDLPNPNSGIDAVTLKDGRQLLVYNHTVRGRSPLNVAISPDGQTWQAALELENEPNAEFSYPAIIQTSDRLVHITYTWKRQKIKHVVLDLAKLAPRDMATQAAAEPQAASKPAFAPQNPVNFSYPYYDGTKERTITELRDPAILREGDTYYLVFTHFPFTHHTSRDPSKPDLNSSPGIRLYSSKDLKSWKFETWLVKSAELSENCPYKHRFWAPEIRKMGGRFFLIFYADNWIKDAYNSDGKMGYVAFVGVADTVTGPYQHISWLNGAGCDTTLFEDTDGKTYAIMPFGDEYIQEVDLTGIDRGDIKLVGPRKRIVARDNSDVGKKTSPDYMEGPWMIKRAGKYILFTASPYQEKKNANGEPPDLAPGYWVGTAVADNIWGPYKKEPQVFLGGHIAVFTGPDGKEWYSYRGESGGKSQGRLCVDPISFTDDGRVKPSRPSTLD